MNYLKYSLLATGTILYLTKPNENLLKSSIQNQIITKYITQYKKLPSSIHIKRSCNISIPTRDYIFLKTAIVTIHAENITQYHTFGVFNRWYYNPMIPKIVIDDENLNNLNNLN